MLTPLHPPQQLCRVKRKHLILASKKWKVDLEDIVSSYFNANPEICYRKIASYCLGLKSLRCQSPEIKTHS